MFALPHESASCFEKRIRVLKSINLKDAKKLQNLTNSKKGLLFFQAACCWIYTTKQGYTFPLIQMKKNFSYLQKNEVFNHELVHAKRACLSAQKFEEIIAFSISRNPWRRFLGPLFSTKVEQVTTFLAASLCPFTSYLSLLFPLFFLLRLVYRQILMKKCKTFLTITSLKKEMLYHLTDQEIQQFAKHIPFKRPLTLRAYQLLTSFKK